MDEKKLAELLKGAVAEAPPATFGVTEVTAESERQRVRHRNGLLAGSALGVAMLAGATALGVALWTGQSSPREATSAGDAASSSNEGAAPYEVPDEENKAAPQTESGGDQEQDIPPESPKQGGTSDGNAGSAGPGSAPSGCEQADRELAAALAGELPAAARVSAEDALPIRFDCPAQSRGAEYRINNDATGFVSVIVVPPGVNPPQWPVRNGGQTTQKAAASGATIVLISEPDAPGGTPPFSDEQSSMLTELAKRF